MKIFPAFLLIALPAMAQVRVIIENDPKPAGARYPKVNACNQTPTLQAVEGWRFRTKDFGGYTTWMAGLTKEGAGPVEYTQPVPESERIMAAGQCRVAPTDYTGAPSAGLDGTLFDAQALVKTGSCHDQPEYDDAPAHSCAAAEGVTRQAGYYGQGTCLLPPAAQGGFVAAFAGHTQIRAALPQKAFAVSNNLVKWDPRVMGPQYMMALAAAQEIFHADMRVMAAVAGKETFFGLVLDGKESDGSLSEKVYVDQGGTLSAWQLEDASLLRIIQTYPSFFPKYGACLGKYPILPAAFPACAPSTGDIAAFYLKTPGSNRMTPNSPHIVNAVVSSALSFYWILDALVRSTDLVVPQAMTLAVDKRAILAALLAGYNQGPMTGFADPLKDLIVLTDPDASSRFPAGNSNYRPDIFALLDALDTARAQSTPCGGAAPLYDTAITLAEVQRFLFGGTAAPGTPAAQGNGGLLLHFDLSAASRQALWDEVQCTFDKLKGKAPSTTGRDAISYRYDWLTVLRAAKQRLDAPRQAAPEADFRNLSNRYSAREVTSTGRPKDKTYPRLTLLPGQVAAESTTVRIPVAAQDAGPGIRLDYTLDSLWVDWQPADTSRTPHVLPISCRNPRFPAPGKSVPVWARATDTCGNSTIQEFDFSVPDGYKCGDPVSIAKAPVPHRAGPRLRLIREKGALRIRAKVPDASGRARTAEMDGRLLGHTQP